MAYTTAITGLTAQGTSALSGLVYSNNDVSVTMTSSEYAQPNFKYIVEVTDNNAGQTYKFYIAQNAANSGIFNAKTIFNQLVQTNIVYPNSDDVILQTAAPTLTTTNNVNTFTIQCFEGYDVGGVFTEDPSVSVYYDLMCVYGSGKQNFIVMGTNDTKPLALSQCYDDEIGFNKETLSKKLNLPSLLAGEVINWQRVSRTDVTEVTDSAYKILTFIADDNTFINSGYPYNSISYFGFDLYDANYSLVAQFNIPMSFGAGALLILPVGLKNLVDGGYVTDVIADSTISWVVTGYDVSDNQITTRYGFYIDEDCKYNPVHVYWLNQLGGWDSFSFIKKNERSIEVEKKRFKAYQGDFNLATSTNPYETKNYTRELTEREPIVNTFINLTSDWLCESEFKFMRDLFMSKSVWMVDDNVDGYSIVPVVVEDNNYLMKRERNSRKYNQTLRLQIANNNETLNITASEYPINPPVTCTYFDTFIKIGGSSSLTVGANVGNAANIVVNNATRGSYITVSVQGTGGITPIAGQSYFVKLDYTANCPSPVIKNGYINLGNVITGGGTQTSFTLQSSGTSIIASGVWGTTANPVNNFYIKLPTWSNVGSLYSGNIYVTVGFGNDCA